MSKLIVDVILFDEIINYCVTYEFDLTLFQQHNHGQDSKGYSSSDISKIKQHFSLVSC